MRTLQLPNAFSRGLMVGSLAFAAATPTLAPIAAAEPASSVSFVNRDALSATNANGWRNPLRANTSTTGAPNDANDPSASVPSNSLRDGVTPVSYEQETGSSGGVKLRPHTEQSGIFSGFMGDSKKPAFRKPKSMTTSAKQPQFTQTRSAPMAPNTAAQKALSLMPQFETSAARKRSQAAAAAAKSATSTHAGSIAQRPAQAPTQRVATRTGAQPSYSTAASAQAYHHEAPPAGAAAVRTSTPRRPWALNQANQQSQATQPTQAMQSRPISTKPGPLSRPSLNSSRPTASAPAAKPRLSATPPSPTAVDDSSPAGILTQAHQLAETARTEADFSKIFALCQQVPARTATPEETAFGRQLAAWSLNRRGQVRARSGNNKDAMADFDQAIRIDAKCWRALHNRGVLLAQSGQFEPAFDDFHHTIELNPSFAKAYANRGALYVLAGELEPALADYQQAAELDPNFAIAERGCGRTCHMLGRVDEALDHLSRAIELAPQDAAAIASRGDLLTDMGQYEAAESDYELALSINPKYADACRGSAWLLATCPDDAVRNPSVALERAQHAVELERKPNASTLDTLAAAQASAGDFEAAAQTIRRAIELAPPSERSVYQDRMQMYRQSKAYRSEPIGAEVQQAGFAQ